MRKHIILAVAVLSCLGMLACGGGETSAEVTQAPKQEATQAPEQEATKAPEKEEDTTPTEKPVETPTEKGTDFYSFEVQVDGETHKFPMWYKEFEAKGWKCLEDMSEDAPAMATGTFSFEKNGIQYDVEMFNSSVNVKPMEECAVSGFRSDSFYYPNGAFPDIVLPGNIKLGVATEDDVVKAYGEPGDFYDGGDDYRVLYYEYAEDQYVHLTIESGILTEVEIQNIVVMEDGDYSVSYAVPDYFESYQAPTSDIGDEEHMVFEMNGTYYELPCPITVLLDNGFSILDTYQQLEMASGSAADIRLRYGNHSIDAVVCNYTDYATGIMNCHVVEISADDSRQKMDLSVLGGIKVGTSIAEVETLLASFDFEKSKGHENTDYSSTTYVVRHPERATTRYYIYCSDRKDAVAQITLYSSMEPTGGTGAPTEKTAESAVTEVPEDSIYNFCIRVHGDDLKAPMSYAELAAKGWILDEEEDASAQLEAGESKSHVWWEKDGYSIVTVLTNTTDSALTMSECTVTEVQFDKFSSIPFYEWDTYNGEVLLPGGIKFFESTRVDIEAAYGEPSTGTATEEYYHLWYTYHDGRAVNLWVDNDTGVLYYISITNR